VFLYTAFCKSFLQNTKEIVLETFFRKNPALVMVMARYIILFHSEFGDKIQLSDYVILIQK